jgi:hypothetical protein
MSCLQPNVSKQVVLNNIDLRSAGEINHVAARIVKIIIAEGNRPDAPDVDCLTLLRFNWDIGAVKFIICKCRHSCAAHIYDPAERALIVPNDKKAILDEHVAAGDEKRDAAMKREIVAVQDDGA